MLLARAFDNDSKCSGAGLGGAAFGGCYIYATNYTTLADAFILTNTHSIILLLSETARDFAVAPLKLVGTVASTFGAWLTTSDPHGPGQGSAGVPHVRCSSSCTALHAPCARGALVKALRCSFGFAVRSLSLVTSTQRAHCALLVPRVSLPHDAAAVRLQITVSRLRLQAGVPVFGIVVPARLVGAFIAIIGALGGVLMLAVSKWQRSDMVLSVYTLILALAAVLGFTAAAYVLDDPPPAVDFSPQNGVDCASACFCVGCFHDYQTCVSIEVLVLSQSRVFAVCTHRSDAHRRQASELPRARFCEFWSCRPIWLSHAVPLARHAPRGPRHVHHRQRRLRGRAEVL